MIVKIIVELHYLDLILLFFLFVDDEKVIELHKVFEDAVTYMNRSKFKFQLLLMTCLSRFLHIFAWIHYLWKSDYFSPCRMKTCFYENQ